MLSANFRKSTGFNKLYEETKPPLRLRRQNPADVVLKPGLVVQPFSRKTEKCCLTTLGTCWPMASSTIELLDKQPLLLHPPPQYVFLWFTTRWSQLWSYTHSPCDDLFQLKMSE